MRSMATNVELQINELLGVLDGDIQYLNANLALLDELRSLVVKRDEAQLCRLLEKVQKQPESNHNIESKRTSIRIKLAETLGWDLTNVTLSKLETVAGSSQRPLLSEKKKALRSLTARLRKEYFRTTLLLSDCARFNRLLLSSIMESGGGGEVVYTSHGTKKQQSQTAFMDMQF